MPFGKRLKDARISRKMTQEELAKAVGVTKGAIGNYEAEISSPKETILIKLMRILEVDANYLYQDYIASDDDLTNEERDLILLYRGADKRARDDALDTLRKHQKKDTELKAR